MKDIENARGYAAIRRTCVLWMLYASTLCISCAKELVVNAPSSMSSEYAFLTALQSVEREQIGLSLADGRLPVFRQVDGDFKLMDGCHYPVLEGLRFHGVSSLDEMTIAGSSRGELSERAAKGDAFKGHLCHEDIVTHVTVAGEWSAPLDQPLAVGLLGPNCQGATHVGISVGVGAFRTLDLGGGGRCSAQATVVAQEGALSNCAQSSDDHLPPLCDSPIGMSLSPIQYEGEFKYHFKDGVVQGVQGAHATMSSDEMKALADRFGAEVDRQARDMGIAVLESSRPNEGDVLCMVSASAESSIYILECHRDDVLILQESGEKETLPSLVSSAANQLIMAADSTSVVENEEDLAPRVVILVDVSGSMVVNDVNTFMTGDTRASSRYQIVDNLLRGILDNGIEASVAIVPFSSTGCARPVVIDGRELWSLDDESRESALNGALAESLGADLCSSADGTNMAEAISKAASLFDRGRDTTRDTVILITDGAHNSPDGEFTPVSAGLELREAGATLNVVRVQLNDLRNLRRLRPEQKMALFSGWARFSNEDPKFVRKRWLDWAEGFSSENDDGRELLDDLIDLDAAIDNFILGSNDVLANPLLIVHEYLLPQVTGVVPIETARCERPQILEDGGVYQFFCDMQIPMGRSISVRVSRPRCMGHVEKAYLQVGGYPATVLELAWDNGGTAAFVRADFGEGGESGDEVEIVSARLTVEGDLRRGAAGCNE